MHLSLRRQRLYHNFHQCFRPVNRAYYDGYAFVIRFGQCKFRENNIAFEKDYFDCSRRFINRICGSGHNKGALASSADSVSVKGIKLLAGNTIPIVGGAIGDAYTSVLGSLNLIKGTVGAFGIFAIAAVNIPVITEMLLWMIAVNICSALCGLLGEENAAKVLDGVSGVYL